MDVGVAYFLKGVPFGVDAYYFFQLKRGQVGIRIKKGDDLTMDVGVSYFLKGVPFWWC